MELEAITRQEQIIAGKDLQPVTRMEFFLKAYGGGGSGGGVTTLHINVTAVNLETMNATFTADKTPAEMQQASVTGPIWCVVTFAAGVVSEEAVSIGVPPAWYIGGQAFGVSIDPKHVNTSGENKERYFVMQNSSDSWILDLSFL